MSYTRDLQEDKPALFDALDTVADCVEVMTELMRRLAVDREALAKALQGGGMLATELADYLVTRGVPFREAHAVTGRIVRWALDEGRELPTLSLEELRRFSPKFEPTVLQRLTVQGAINRKAQTGGTAQKLVERRIREEGVTSLFTCEVNLRPRNDGSLRFHVRRERGVLDFAVAANAQGAHLYPQIAYDFLVDGDGQGIVNLADAGYVHGNLDAVHDMITHPVTVIGLADAGAHVRLICDGSSPSTQLTH